MGGATMCFGFILYRATVGTLAFFAMSLPSFLGDPDDQRSFQMTLKECTKVVWNHGHRFPKNETLAQELKPKPWYKPEDRINVDTGVTEKKLTSSGVRFSFSLLPFNEVPRRCGKRFGFPEKQPGCFVVHCEAPRNGEAKLKKLRDMKLIFLRAGWNATRRA